jgi:hypothetical protein
VVFKIIDLLLMVETDLEQTTVGNGDLIEMALFSGSSEMIAGVLL